MYLRPLLVICLLSCASAQRRPFNQQRPVPTQRPYVDPNLVPSAVPSAGRAYSNTNEAGAEILSQVSDVNPDGSFYTKYETSNGIAYEEQGAPKGTGTQDQAQQVQGTASWTSADGQRIALSWLADENGVNFQGDHIPTPPPIPEAIQRALAWIAANPSRDPEGQYRGDDEGNYAGLRQTVYTTTRRPDVVPQQNFAPRRPSFPGRRN